MKKLMMFFLSLAILPLITAQERAVTEKGDEVILNPDGTWEYVDKEILEASAIPINPNRFFKDDKATFLLKSKKFNIGFWLDPKKWSFSKAVDNPDAEYELVLKDEDAYAMIITERISMPITTLRSIAIENAMEAFSNLKIVEEEYRTVNGLEVLFLHMNLSVEGMKMSFYGYYYSNDSGTVQFVTFTSQNMIITYKSFLESLLNGMVELD